jgi:protease-4
MRRVWIVLGILVFVLVALAVAVVVLLQRQIGRPVEFAAPAVLEIDLEGPVVEKFPTDPFVIGLEGSRYQLIDIVRALRAAGEDDRIRGIYLRVGSPGYGWAKAEEIRDRLLEFRKTGKFVYAYATPTDELGYYVALAANRVYLLPDAGLVLNGFSVETPFIRRAFEKLGLEAQVENVGVYKSAADMLKRDDMSDEEREVTESILRERYDRFVGVVVEARDVDRAAFTEAFDRGLYLARDLSELGLIDGELYEPDVRALALRAALGEDENDEERGNEGAVEDAGEPLDRDAFEHFVRLEDYVSELPSEEDGPGGTIALVYAVGAIARGEDTVDPLFGRTMGSASTIDMLREVAHDERVDAVVLRVDSPGGDAWASEEIWAQLEELKRTVPLVVSMSDVAGSGGYYIAAGADQIVAAPSTITGSIGVLGVIFNAAETWDKLGITWGMVKTNEAADFPTTIRPLTEAERATFQAVIQAIYRNFVARVAAGRKRSVEEIDAVAQGRIWSGTQAQERGLVDRVGGIGTALEAAKELADIEPSARVGLLIYPKEKTFLEQLMDMAFMRGAALVGQAGGGPALEERAALQVARELRETLTAAAAALREGPGRPLAVMPFVPRIR